MPSSSSSSSSSNPKYSEVEIRVKCSGLANKDTFSKSDPQCILLVQGPGGPDAEYVEVCRTEKVENNLNPEFETGLRIPYFFQQRQHIRLQLIDCDGRTDGKYRGASLGHYDCRLTQLLGKSVTAEMEEGKGKITLQCEEVSNCKDMVEFRGVTGNMKSKEDYYLVWHRTGEGDPVLIHRTQYPPKSASKSKHPEWPEFSLSADVLDKGDDSRKIVVEVWDWDRIGSDDHIGTCTFFREELLKGGRHTLTKPVMHTKKGKEKEVGTLTFDYEVSVGYSFVDYLKAGLELNMFMAIDFTGSNGHPADADSLHAQGPHNQYAQAIESLGDVLSQYDSDGMIEAYGYGAKLPDGTTSHCFPLNMDLKGELAEVHGVKGVLHHYEHFIKDVMKGEAHFSGPTNFRRFLDRLNFLARVEPGKPANKCYVGIILTDGAISDLSETVERIVVGSHEPIFLIIVGVGDADFSTMSSLDADDGPLKAGSKVQFHDNVQFVEKRRFTDGTAFTNAVLGELPDQVVRYMKYKGLRPGGLP